jgi:DNA ligase-1
LRFPRFIRSRPDKAIEQASTAEFLAQMWQNQQGKGKREGVDDGDLIDVDLEHEEDEDEEDLYEG